MTRRRCKCQVCKSPGYTDEFYRVTKNGRNLYYCNQDEYVNAMVEESNRIEMLGIIRDQILPKHYRFVPPALQKQLNELAELYNYEVVLEAVLQNRETLMYWMNLEGKFNNDFGRACYFTTIIKNDLPKIYKEWADKRRREETSKEMEDNKYNVDIDTLNKIVEQKPVKQDKDSVNTGILEFLTEDDL